MERQENRSVEVSLVQIGEYLAISVDQKTREIQRKWELALIQLWVRGHQTQGADLVYCRFQEAIKILLQELADFPRDLVHITVFAIECSNELIIQALSPNFSRPPTVLTMDHLFPKWAHILFVLPSAQSLLVRCYSKSECTEISLNGYGDLVNSEYTSKFQDPISYSTKFWKHCRGGGQALEPLKNEWKTTMEVMSGIQTDVWCLCSIGTSLDAYIREHFSTRNIPEIFLPSKIASKSSPTATSDSVSQSTQENVTRQPAPEALQQTHTNPHSFHAGSSQPANFPKANTGIEVPRGSENLLPKVPKSRELPDRLESLLSGPMQDLGNAGLGWGYQ